MSKKKLGLVRVGAAVPMLKVANTKYNGEQIIDLIEKAEKESTGFLLFPELAITGYSCGDLFYQEHLYQSQLDVLADICSKTKGKRICLIIGCYFRISNDFYNCAALIQNGQIKGVVPKMFIPNSKEFYEERWFTSGIGSTYGTIRLFGNVIPFGELIFEDQENDLAIGAEICEDLWRPASPGSRLALNGAHIIFNPSASNETVGKADYRRDLVKTESAKSNCGYVYTSAGISESTSEVVFGGHSMIAENGSIIAEGQRFLREGTITYSEIDFQRIKFERVQAPNFSQTVSTLTDSEPFRHITLEPVPQLSYKDKLYRKYGQNPFLSENPHEVEFRHGDIFSIQAAGLAKRIEHSHSRKSVIGISGGLDSTLALLVCAYTHKLLGIPAADILAVTMPGFGTTGKTYHNALTIMKLLGTDIREISIKDAVSQHFKDIGQDPQLHDVTYENSQARERTQILMDLANKENGLVVGTGDLSEMALGWCTYNGDQMSMYGVNAGVPKTLVRHVIKWAMEHLLTGSDIDSNFSQDDGLLRRTLQDILDTPISPELLPPDPKGDIVQKTEESVGPYVLHDFFIYYTIRYGMTPEKLLFTATNAFEGQYDKEFIKKWLSVFYRRFFSQQFKRSAMPEGPKVGSVSLSPRGDWRMPSDADVAIWLDEL